MKLITTILAILAIAVSVASCKKKDPQRMPEGSDRIIVHVRAHSTLRTTSTETISIEECMKRTNSLICTPVGYDRPVVGAINEEDKDYATNSIKMRAWHIIDNGEFQDFLGTSRDFILLHGGDTVGYIPNRLVHEAFSKAKQYYQEQRYEDVVNVFTTAFTAHPCTGAQYRALKQQGQN